ncbi:Bug family tripartite tricarboxylate transporter substrate binding protein [Falsiroseomonas tokyonensis]|uniref:Bug family tripartite tricarboxylate transporter substrate binding protein n=1 Tax=Falsiroseomonas tokyonensis TaxID=430521 RepID=A0ABV7BTK7_9PROT|nr:tripartite tricarboxylate transporter substrate binding protein [Falsiroseomonas tokyonensis]MBU8538372.1 tripartite tricarboxylate transporter substrate binding protein [Falsiroseomonas tokyonensis]
MTRTTRRLILGATLAAPFAARGQDAWRPSRPIRLIVPFAPGGLTDILARAVADRLNPVFGQPVVVENRAGAGGNLAAEALARATPDGHTLLVATQGIIAINKALFARLPYDPDEDFVPIAMLAQQPNLLVVSPRALPNVSNLQELIAAARNTPGGMPYGSNGVGSFTHLSMELLRAVAGLEMTHVPYRGSAPLLTDMVAGTIPVAFDGLATSAPQVGPGGALRAIAVTSGTRFRAMPQVPAVAETLPGFDASPWYGIFAQSKLDEPVLDALEAGFRRVLESPEWAALLEQRQADAMPQGRVALAQVMARERRVWREAVARSGARAD